MLRQQIQDQLNNMRLRGMARAYEEQRANASLQAMSFEERLGFLINAQEHDDEQRRMERFLRDAKLKYPNAFPEDIDYVANRGLDRQLVVSLLDCDWIDRLQHVVITGPTGVGKTHLGCTFGHQAARKGKRVLYCRQSRHLEEIEVARADGTLPKLRARVGRMKLLILDDWGIAPLTPRARQDLLEIVEDRTSVGSLLITSQLPVEQWHDWIGEPTLADAILDRIVHRAHRIILRGESMRKLYAEK